MKRKYPIMIYVLMMIIMITTACSKVQNSDNSNKSSTEFTKADFLPLNINSGANINNKNFAINNDTGKLIMVTSKTAINITSENTTTNKQESEKKKVAIDAGHQSKGNYEEEPIGPGAKVKKPKVSSGTQGNYTRVAEYKLNLVIAKKVKEELIDRGYEVYMIRDTNNVNISNKERAEMANKSGADIFIRIHADSSTNTKVTGTSTLYPSKNNPYVSELSKDSYELSKSIVDAMCEKTEAKNRGAIARDDMSGINWCKIPVSIIEMGYMSNKKEDKLMQTTDYQKKIVQGICDGIDAYYK